MSNSVLLLRYILGQIESFLLSIWSWIVGLWDIVVGGGSSRSRGGIGEVIEFDNGRRVKIVRQLAEGGYAMIYVARDISPSSSSSSSTQQQRDYALKRMLCPDNETKRKCQEEASIHRSFRHHDHLMPLLGLKFDKSCRYGEYDGLACYMLFPLMRSSLRDEMTERNLLSMEPSPRGGIRPWKEREVLEIFAGVVDGVKAMHMAGYAHRDIKPENVLLDDNNIPVLMDFGSVRPVEIAIPTRSVLLLLVDEAASISTVSYRAPELFEGGARHGDPDLDGRVDVWSLGCLLFCLMYGSSPFECEFRGEFVRIVECSHLRVLGHVPRPSPGTEVSRRYSPELFNCVSWILDQDRMKRPTVDQVDAKVDELLKRCGGFRSRTSKGGSRAGGGRGGQTDDGDFDSLLGKV